MNESEELKSAKVFKSDWYRIGKRVLDEKARGVNSSQAHVIMMALRALDEKERKETK